MNVMRNLNVCANKQKGVAAVEFAIIAILFFMLLFGIVEFGRVLYTWNSAVEATRFGVRTAAVCDIGSDAVLTNMQKIMTGLTAGNVVVSYEPTGCIINTCERVSVRTQNLSITPLIPFFNPTIPVPGFETSLMRESLSSTSNPVCS
jgi:Flp pilus assembly protein TadG